METTGRCLPRTTRERVTAMLTAKEERERKQLGDGEGEYPARKLAWANASRNLVRAIDGTRRGHIRKASGDLLWSSRSGTPTTWAGDSCEQLQTAPRRLTLIEEKERLADRLRVSREPCKMCGVRADRHGDTCRQVARVATDKQILANTDYLDQAWERAFARAYAQAAGE